MRTAQIIRRRAAFTLVELMVSAALIIFMMYILSTAFIAGLESFRTLKTAGDMQEKLRSASAVIRADLCRPHFFSENTSNGGDSLNSQRVDHVDWFPPDKGYFRIYQGSAQGAAGVTEFTEYVDPDEPRASHTRSTDHVLQFTVRLDGKRLHEFFAADIGTSRNVRAYYKVETPPGSGTYVEQPVDLPLTAFNSPDYNRPASTASPLVESMWAEVTYYLRPYASPLYTGTPQNGRPLGQYERFALYRRVKLIVDDPVKDNTKGVTYLKTESIVVGGATESLADLSTWRPVSNALLNRPQDITAPIRRSQVTFRGTVAGAPQALTGRLILPQAFENDPAPDPTSAKAAGDLLLADVLGFTVKALWDMPQTVGTRFLPLSSAPREGWPTDRYSATSYNANFPFDSLPVGRNTDPQMANVRMFDTWSRQSLLTPPPGVPSYDYGGTNPDPQTWSASSNPWNGGHFTTVGVPNPAVQTSMPLRVRVRAVQIEMRVWDVKSRQTRQVTIIQDV